MSETATDFLAHYGVKGMRWGKRKGGVDTSSPDYVPAHSDSVRAKEFRKIAKTKGIDVLSNDDLKALNTRSDLEQKYSKLNPSKIEAGHKKAQAIMAIVGTVGAIATLNSSPAGKAGKAAFNTAKIARQRARNPAIAAITP